MVAVVLCLAAPLAPIAGNGDGPSHAHHGTLGRPAGLEPFSQRRPRPRETGYALSPVWWWPRLRTCAPPPYVPRQAIPPVPNPGVGHNGKGTMAAKCADLLRAARCNLQPCRYCPPPLLCPRPRLGAPCCGVTPHRPPARQQAQWHRSWGVGRVRRRHARPASAVCPACLWIVVGHDDGATVLTTCAALCRAARNI